MIYFVGIHHKPGLPALCSTTRSGKKIDAVIKRIAQPARKVNLFSTDYIPAARSSEYNMELNSFSEWIAGANDTFVLLGAEVARHFPYHYYGHCKIIHFRHPAFSPPSFVDDLVEMLL